MKLRLLNNKLKMRPKLKWAIGPLKPYLMNNNLLKLLDKFGKKLMLMKVDMLKEMSLDN